MKGFTLIETLIAVAILVLLMGIISGSIVLLYKSQSFAWQQSLALDEARMGIKTMVREIREARFGDDGSYPIEKADDKEFIFYADIDKDGETEKVRYFIGAAETGSQTQECVSFADGGSCNITFTDFFQGTPVSAQIKVSVEGDFGWDGQEYADVYADGSSLSRVCNTGCSDCPGIWQGDVIFDITDHAVDNYLDILIDSNYRVNDICNWQNPNHSMKVKVELNWEEDNPELDHLFKKGITNPTTSPISYPTESEEVTIISSYVRNTPPIFKYYNADGNEITEHPIRLSDTKVMKVHLVVNVNPNHQPGDVELESYIQLRNLKE